MFLGYAIACTPIESASVWRAIWASVPERCCLATFAPPTDPLLLAFLVLSSFAALHQQGGTSRHPKRTRADLHV
jgi:hypothetical protein